MIYNSLIIGGVFDVGSKAEIRIFTPVMAKAKPSCK